MMNEMKLHERIRERYEEESASNCVLSCGTTLQELKVEYGEVILDLGCGRGEETIAAARLAGSEGKAIGLDLTDAMVKQAAENASNENVNNTFFIQGDIEALPFQEGFFHGVISNCVINHARDKRRVYREIYRVLQPGGRFVVADAVTKYPLPAEVKKDADAWAQCFGGAITEEEYLESILSAGFDRIEILNRREYKKNGYDFISLTIKAVK